MARVHTVRQGECFSSIARRYGFSSHLPVYNAPENAELRKKRPNPNILAPGDVIHIPELQTPSFRVATGRTHTFRLKKEKTTLRLVVRDAQGREVEGKRFRLEVAEVIKEGSLNAAGLVEADIPHDASEGTLRVWWGDDTDDESAHTITLKIGHLDPVDQPTGVQARLNNLGFRCGQVDGIRGPQTEAALKEFQARAGLKITGEPDAATVSKLEQLHEHSDRNAHG